MIPLSEDRPEAGPVPPPPDLPAMRARFTADFVGGRIGRHHNTFQHRERVLRQLGEAARRAGEPAAAAGTAGASAPVPANPIFREGR